MCEKFLKGSKINIINAYQGKNQMIFKDCILTLDKAVVWENARVCHFILMKNQSDL